MTEGQASCHPSLHLLRQLTSNYAACPLFFMLDELQGSSKACYLWRPSQLPVLAHDAGPAGQGLQETPLGLREAHLP